MLKQCKKGIKIINVGRGGLINERDLLDGLKSGQVRYILLTMNDVSIAQSVVTLPADQKVASSNPAKKTFVR